MGQRCFCKIYNKKKMSKFLFYLKKDQIFEYFSKLFQNQKQFQGFITGFMQLLNHLVICLIYCCLIYFSQFPDCNLFFGNMKLIQLAKLTYEFKQILNTKNL
ncbi:transmembrane protein, putative (macronuclear) [Tetrahymena thermophila SB210]|uniref:Transmembrane protein, putative n=1 Tax=Tetrahymena thermophila (strain SB210) TaxID=312017 RepID=W7X786_TETTS|nr:transmembrane protein, putative [Tetrahymena thermophila SB210]EWS75255.1 transmembrane protein, putative [Tetrahymena thermophila SB210]|eukprot:XP_012652246.1 transmembrane protein, putative [Tetrahymena thermophila SB210]